MSKQWSEFHILPCLDSEEMAADRRRELDIPRDVAAALGRSAVEAGVTGYYLTRAGEKVDLARLINIACSAKRSIPPDAPLPNHDLSPFPETRIQVTNETTLGASLRLVDSGLRPLALNFANGVHPGGGFLNGARAQEEVLCRSSALYRTLLNDRMYEEHRKRPRPDSTDWAIYSPDVPVYRKDDGTALDQPWLLSFITCAAPYAPAIGQPESGDLLQKRIHRVLSIAQAFGHSALALGAWGCGAFGNDARRAAIDFRQALETEFQGVFSDGSGPLTNSRGQQAPIVFFSMATSSGEDVPRNLAFLFSRNRLNVAISRAQCLAYLVCSPRLLEARCKTIEEMELVNALCRLVEYAGRKNT